MNKQSTRWPIDDDFDEEFAGELARLESFNKHIYRPNTYLHKWWARRCGTTFRLIIKQLVMDSRKRDFYVGGGLSGKVVLDPMMGGGTTLHEAIRLGANVVGIDIDPIPLLQARATLSKVDLPLLRIKYLELYDYLSSELGPLFQTRCPLCELEVDLQFMLYGLVQLCDCRGGIILDSHLLRTEPDGTRVVICSQCHQVYTDLEGHNCHSLEEKRPIYQKGIKYCRFCGALFQEDLTKPFYSRYRPVAAACRCPRHGFQLASVSRDDLELIDKSERQRGLLLPNNRLEIAGGPKSDALIRKGIRHYEELFSSRQIIYIIKAAEFTAECDELIGLNLGLLVSTSLDMNAMLCGYKGTTVRRAGAVRHVFSHHAYSFPYTALENNPIYPEKVSGSIKRIFSDRIERGKKWALEPKERALDNSRSKFVTIRGEVDLGQGVADQKKLTTGHRRFFLQQKSAADSGLHENSVDFIVTDPPYYDSVQYQDLAAYFRGWLQQLLPEKTQEGIKWDYISSSAVVGNPNRNHDPQLEDAYLTNLSAVLLECQRVLRSDSGRLIFTFHHWKALAWGALTIALRGSHFSLVNYYIVHSENPMSVHIANLKSIQHDAILVLAPNSIEVGKEWHPPEHFNMSDSREFCGNCSQLLGALLNSDYQDQDIVATWEERIG